MTFGFAGTDTEVINSPLVEEAEFSQVFIGGDDPSELVPLNEVERRYILHVLATVGGNKTLAARLLGLDRKTLYRKLQQYGEQEGG